MKLNDDAKHAVRNLGEAVNSAISESPRISEAIEHLREIGYEANLTLKLEIGLNELLPENDDILNEDVLILTDEDLKTLRSMKIRLE